MGRLEGRLHCYMSHEDFMAQLKTPEGQVQTEKWSERKKEFQLRSLQAQIRPEMRFDEWWRLMIVH